MDYEEALLQVTDVLKAHNRYHMNTPDHEQAVMLIREIVTPKGKWIEVDNGLVSGRCSLCGWEAVIMETDVCGMPFCPNCGARMER